MTEPHISFYKLSRVYPANFQKQKPEPNNYPYTLHAFDCEGNMIHEKFNSAPQAVRHANRFSLEIFDIA